MLEEASNRIADVASAIADGRAVDWDAVESSSSDETERAVVRRLRAIADIGRAHAGVVLSESFSLLTSLSAAVDSTAPSEPGTTWGSLRIVERIGRGRFGDVYRAWDPNLEREVALKLLRHRDDDPNGSAQEVVEEGRLMARVRHPNVVTIFGAQRLEGRTGLWMEYIPGRTLEAELKERGPFSAAEVAQVGVALCRALTAVHAAGLVHRDVKAQNVLRDARTGHVLLGDFGTGRELDDGDATPGIAGTPAYLAPEIFRRESATPQSDLYSLGALLFHLATGSFPVSGRSLRELREAHSEGRRTPIQTVCPALPTPLAAAIEKALDPDPAVRFADAASMETALAAAIAPPSKSKWIIAGGIIAVVGVVLAFAVGQDGQAPSGGGGAGSAAAGADSPLIRSLGDRAVWTGREVDMFGRVSPDGRLISYVDWLSLDDLAVHDIATNTNRLLTHKTSYPDMNSGWAGSSVFSPDSKQLAYAWHDDHESGVRILSPSSTGTATKPRQLIRFDRKDVRFAGPLDWSPDGRLIALGLARTDGSGQIIVASVSDGSFRRLKSLDWNGPVHIFFSPDSKYIAYELLASDSTDQHDLHVLAIDGSGETVVAAHPADEWVIGWTPDGSRLLFSSDRTGSNGLWAVPMANGRPAGPAELVRPDIGLSAYSLGRTSSGSVVVYKHVSSRDIRLQGIDLAAGKLVGPLVAFTRGFVPGAQDPNWSPDGKSLAYQACRPLSSCVVVRNVDTGEVRRLSIRAVNYGRDPRWSPDGSSLLMGSRDSKGRDGIFRYDLKTDVVTPLTYGPPNWSSPRWSADGSKIYFDSHAVSNPRIIERDLRSGTERDVFVGASRNFEVSPDGTKLAVKTSLDSATKTSRLLLVPVNGGPPRELMRFNEQESLPQIHTFAWSPDSRSVLTARRSGASVALWLVPTGDGQPRRLDIDVDGWALADREGFPSNGDDSGFALSPDGTRIAYLVGRSTVEVWALENVLPRFPAR
jgi:serine/threonine-protein kinase